MCGARARASYPVLRADGPVPVSQQVGLAREGYAVSNWSVAASVERPLARRAVG